MAEIVAIIVPHVRDHIRDRRRDRDRIYIYVLYIFFNRDNGKFSFSYITFEHEGIWTWS